MSRPRLSATTRRTRLLQVRVTKAERARFSATAAKAGLSLSSWARTRLLAAAAKVRKRRK